MSLRSSVIAVCTGWVLFSAPVVFAQAAPSGEQLAKQPLPQKAAINDRATRALFKAVYKDNLAAVKAAIAQGANLDARDNSDTKPVDIAIDRGNFDIAHLLISTRNQRQAKKDEVLASPTKPGSSEIESIAKPRKTAITDAPSATKRFFSTFLNFFNPPNTTGIVERPLGVNGHKNDAARDAVLRKRIRNAQDNRAAALQKTTKPIKTEPRPKPRPRAPSVLSARDVPLPPIVKDTLPVPMPVLTEKRPSKTQRTSALNKGFTSKKPFNGGVDPDILAFLAANTSSQQPPKQQADTTVTQNPFTAPPKKDPFAAKPKKNPFAAPAIAAPRKVASLKAKRPSLPKAKDPFATPSQNNPFARPFAQDKKTAKPDGWDVKSVKRAQTPQILPALSDIKSAGVVLSGADFRLGADITIGQKISKQQLNTLKEKTIFRPCFSKNSDETVFCVDKINWPLDLEKNFQVDTIMYQGTRAIVRYDAGRATNILTLFKSKSFAKIVGYYTKRYGSPTKILQRSIAPLAAPRRDNPTYIWKSREPGTDIITALEIRKYDDARGGFPDTQRGVIMLYSTQSGKIFPQLSQLELMVMRDDTATNQKSQTPGNIWNTKP